MHSKSVFLLVFLSLPGLVAGCMPPMAAPGRPGPLASPLNAPAPTATAGPLQLTILHTNDTWGYFLPCG
jgi:2',3'-cyclic-nucleotide 2'-phosphodiesterase (5'-nucleotidase family)